MKTTEPESVQEVADAICGALAFRMPEPLHKMAYEDAARAAIEASHIIKPPRGDPPE